MTASSEAFQIITPVDSQRLLNESTGGQNGTTEVHNQDLSDIAQDRAHKVLIEGEFIPQSVDFRLLSEGVP